MWKTRAKKYTKNSDFRQKGFVRVVSRVWKSTMSKTYGESKFKLSHANDINRKVNNNSFRRVYQIYDFSL